MLTKTWDWDWASNNVNTWSRTEVLVYNEESTETEIRTDGITYFECIYLKIFVLLFVFQFIG